MYSFGEVVDKFLMNGVRVRRAAWVEGVFIFLVKGSTFNVNRAPLLGHYPAGTQITYHPHIDMCLQTGEICVWGINQEDVLESDWETYITEDKVE